MTETEFRVEQIVDLMCRGQWLAGVSDKMLAQRWACSAVNVRRLAAEANRVLRTRVRTDKTAQLEARAELLQFFMVVRSKAMMNGDSQSLRVALDAARAYGFYLGIEPAKRLEVNDRPSPVDGWTLEEQLAFAETGKRPTRALIETNGEDASSMH